VLCTIFYSALISVCLDEAGATQQLKDELRARFPAHGVLDAMSIVYPQYWRDEKVAKISFRKHLNVCSEGAFWAASVDWRGRAKASGCTTSRLFPTLASATAFQIVHSKQYDVCHGATFSHKSADKVVEDSRCEYSVGCTVSRVPEASSNFNGACSGFC
jgi:hypothetical protein